MTTEIRRIVLVRTKPFSDMDTSSKAFLLLAALGLKLWSAPPIVGVRLWSMDCLKVRWAKVLVFERNSLCQIYGPVKVGKTVDKGVIEILISWRRSQTHCENHMFREAQIGWTCQDHWAGDSQKDYVRSTLWKKKHGKTKTVVEGRFSKWCKKFTWYAELDCGCSRKGEIPNTAEAGLTKWVLAKLIKRCFKIYCMIKTFKKYLQVVITINSYLQREIPIFNIYRLQNIFTYAGASKIEWLNSLGKVGLPSSTFNLWVRFRTFKNKINILPN